jgi:NAD/NADP transhydrogenase alpha subunit
MARIERMSAFIYLTLFVNVFDIVIHIVAGELEVLRVIANTFVIISSVLLLTNVRYRLLFTASLCLYILLNMVFVVLYGIGVLGILLIATTLFAGVVIIRNQQKNR